MRFLVRYNTDARGLFLKRSRTIQNWPRKPHSMSPKPAPMTLGNMRANGVRTLAASCLGRDGNHHRVLDMSGYPGDLPVPSFGPRLRCEVCGHRGADVRPNWNEMYKQEPNTRASSAFKIRERPCQKLRFRP